MSSLNKNPFMVRVTYRNGSQHGVNQISYNFESLGSALNRRAIELTRPVTVKVELFVMIDEAFRKPP